MRRVSATRRLSEATRRRSFRTDGYEHATPASTLARCLAQYPEARLRINLDYVAAHRMLHSPEFYFVQIGAFDGRTNDPICEHVRRHGWRGVLVEPQPHYFRQLEATYRNVPGLTLRNVAISERHEKRPLYTVKDRPGLPALAPQYASFNRSHVQSNFPGIELEEITLDCITLDELLSEAASDHIDLIQIDVEGYDAEIIRLLDLDRWKPAIVNFEHNHLSHADYATVLDKLVAHGYRLAIGGLFDMDTLVYKC
jgi:FkbM family methyltransferase